MIVVILIRMVVILPRGIGCVLCNEADEALRA